MRKPWDYEEPACAEVGTNMFFQPDPDDNEAGAASDRYTYARSVCKTCPHLIECAEWGLKNESHGMWGGTSPRERANMRTKLGIPVVRRVDFNAL